jgi:hypothetical protein
VAQEYCATQTSGGGATLTPAQFRSQRKRKGTRYLGFEKASALSEPRGAVWASAKTIGIDGFVGGPDRDRTDDLFHAIQTTIRKLLKKNQSDLP